MSNANANNDKQKDAFFLKPKDGKYGPYFFGNVDGYAVSVAFTKDGKAKISSGDQFHVAGAKTNDYGEYYSFIFNKRWWFGNKGESSFGPYFKLKAGKDAEVNAEDATLNAPAKKYEKAEGNGNFAPRGGRANTGASNSARVGQGAVSASEGSDTHPDYSASSGSGKAASVSAPKPTLPTPNRYKRNPS